MSENGEKGSEICEEAPETDGVVAKKAKLFLIDKILDEKQKTNRDSTGEYGIVYFRCKINNILRGHIQKAGCHFTPGLYKK